MTDLNDFRIGKKTSYFRNNPKHISLMLEVIDILYDSFDIEIEKEELLRPITSDSEEELRNMIKKHNKSLKKKERKFVLTDDAGNIVKKPLSGYNIYMQEINMKMEKEGSKKKTLQDISKDWNKLSKKEQNKYKKLSDKEKAKFNQMIEEQKLKAIASGDFEKPKPKKPKSAYIYFINDPEIVSFYKEQGFKGIKINSEASKRWKEMSDEEKEPYVKKYEESKLKYEKALEIYHQEVREIKENKLRQDIELARTFKKEHSTSSKNENSSFIEFNYLCSKCNHLNKISIDHSKLMKKNILNSNDNTNDNSEEYNSD